MVFATADPQLLDPANYAKKEWGKVTDEIINKLQKGRLENKLR